MATQKRRHFLNLPVDEQLLARIDETAKRSGIVRAKQARALIEYALGYQRKVCIPAAETPGLPFPKPIQDAPAKRRRTHR